MMPNPNTAKRVRAPPENKLRKLTTPACCEEATNDWTALKSMPGQGMLAPRR